MVLRVHSLRSLGFGRLSSVLYLCGLLMSFGFAAFGAVASDPAKTVGPNACAECHKQEAEAWKGTHHFKTFREMPRNTEANEIAKRMGVRRIKSESLCLNCHFTVQQKDNKEEPISGISCEILPQRREGLDQGPQRVQRQESPDRDQDRGGDALEARRVQGNDQAVLALPAGEELL